MDLQEFRTMKKMVNNLNLNNVEQLAGFANYLAVHGAHKTAKYIGTQIADEKRCVRTMIHYELLRDREGI